MEFADAAVLAGQGYPGPATVMTGDNTTVDPTAPRSTASKLAETPAIDDEDLFLGDEGDHDNDNDDNDNHVEADDEEDEDDDDDDFDEDYFSSTYRPLSNLPTPPPSSHTSSLAQSPYAGAHANGHAHGHAHGPSTTPHASDSPLLGPAVHLVNLLPPAASLATPSVALVQAMLARAALPLDTVALAVCILDSLDSRFARAWRLTCPLTPPAAPTTSLSSSTQSSPPSLAVLEKRHTLPSPLTPTFPTSTPTPTSPSSPSSPALDNARGGLHIDAVFPEVIVLAALVIAAKFTDDGFVSQQPAQAYCTAWGATPPPPPPSSLLPSPGSASPSPPGPCLWTGAQLAATERCIMQNLGYRILPLLDADLLADAKADMRRAGAQAVVRTKRASAVPLSSASGSPSSAKRAPPTKKMALMTPPAEAGVAAKNGAATDRGESRDLVVDTSKVISLNFPSNMRRHVSSRSESLGRYSVYEH